MASESVRMRDVAARAGVALSTVSRVMTNPSRISAETRKLVLDAASELGYQHPPANRARPVGQNTIALLLPEVANPYYFDLIRGSQERLRDSGYAALLYDTGQSRHSELASLEALAEAGTPAILAATGLSNEQLAELAGAFPLVTINRTVPGIPSVSSDTAAVFAQAVDHLVSLGHTKLCYVAGPAVSQSNRERGEACSAEAQRLGVELVSTINFIPSQDSGAAAADAALATGATAALVFSDMLAIGMVTRLAARGVKVPEEFSVVGCDDSYGASFCHPPLTTVAVPSHRIGREATSMLLAMIAGGRPSLGDAVVLPAFLKIRSSTGPAPR